MLISQHMWCSLCIHSWRADVDAAINFRCLPRLYSCLVQC